jgi:mercuric ion binding protein
MRRSLAAAFLTVGLGAAAPALAGEETVTLAVKNMYCAACPLIVKSTLQAVPALTAATANAGYPSAPKG